MTRWAGLVLAAGVVLGGAVGLVLGLRTHVPTAAYAVGEGAVLGGVAALPVAGVLLVVSGITGVLRRGRG
ncbi:hypothetical protein EV189_1216 [Motilibacter rhizosphaerae]|uniref:Uncharacterized protein n=1 Tax=Motilibacter rhizosphaerae TaxID=598652 RepID=A0A4Q7NQW9_9ACTN|nr:hypothetical protein [Motilibacter rhizosphaerae]RZS89453.1 hypothetical protein EV189_1216 [Motilibacter rhizosphaerae]